MFRGKIPVFVKNDHKTKLTAVQKIIYIVIRCRGRTSVSLKESDLTLATDNK